MRQVSKLAGSLQINFKTRNHRKVAHSYLEKMAPSAIESLDPVCDAFVDPDNLRTTFSLAMSAMYKQEVPLYGDLIRIVQEVNENTLRRSVDPKIVAIRNGDVASERLHVERHGAIRLGTPYELQTVRRIFAIMALSPVGYYDLS